MCRNTDWYCMHCVHSLRTGSATFSTISRAFLGRIISLHALSVFQATLKHAIEDMFDSPGFLIAQVAASGPPPTEPLSATHGLDMAAVTNMYTSILRVTTPLWLLLSLISQVAQHASRPSKMYPGIQGGLYSRTCWNLIALLYAFGT